MCPVCLLTTVGISILSGVITTSGLSAVAIKKTVIESSMRKPKTRPERLAQDSQLASRQFKTGETR